MPKDLKLDYENKTVINQFIKGKEQIVQAVILSLQCWAGDWYLDGDFGIEYDLRLDNRALLLADIEEVIMSNEGVISVQDLDVKVKYDENIRYFDITGSISTQEEQVIFNGLIPVIGA